MPFELPTLPFDSSALAPWTSAETLSFHHGKHHAAYVAKLNALVAGTAFDGATLEATVIASRSMSPAIFNVAAQHWNHSFFWSCLTPKPTKCPAALTKAIARDFGSLDAFKEAFGKSALSLFGSGWTWLVHRKDGKLELIQTKDAETPLGSGKTALLTLDVWEHAYYIDHRNDRAAFIAGFWNHVNWQHAASRLG